jgi:intergrase/recombinase
MIIKLDNEGKLGDYYNSEVSVLEHFKYGKIFLRGTKNCYISFVSKALIEKISGSQPVSYDAIICRLRREQIKLRIKELRSYHNSYLCKKGIISELVDVLAGRVPKTVFARHYLGEEMKELSNQVLEIVNNLDDSLGLNGFYKCAPSEALNNLA